MKIEYAPPGTDPTTMKSAPPDVGIKAFVKQNTMLLLGVGLFLLATLAKNNMDALPFIGGSPERGQQAAATERKAQPTATPVAVDVDTNYCLWPPDDALGVMIPAGPVVLGDREGVCEDGKIRFQAAQ